MGHAKHTIDSNVSVSLFAAQTKDHGLDSPAEVAMPE